MIKSPVFYKISKNSIYIVQDLYKIVKSQNHQKESPNLGDMDKYRDYSMQKAAHFKDSSSQSNKT